MARLTINGKSYDLDVEPETPLLWAIREKVGPDRHQVRLRHRPMRRLHRAHRRRGDALLLRSREPMPKASRSPPSKAWPRAASCTRCRQAWIDHDVPQCGYCQSGMIMAVAALLKDKPKPTDADIDDAITNICRCGTFQQVREAIHAAAKA